MAIAVSAQVHFRYTFFSAVAIFCAQLNFLPFFSVHSNLFMLIFRTVNPPELVHHRRTPHSPTPAENLMTRLLPLLLCGFSLFPNVVIIAVTKTIVIVTVAFLQHPPNRYP